MVIVEVTVLVIVVRVLIVAVVVVLILPDEGPGSNLLVAGGGFGLGGEF